MTFLPAVPFGGFLGWQVLDRSAGRQKEIFENEPLTVRNLDYFKENIRTAITPERLVNDRKLLTVALGAFGLEGEIDKKALIRRVLEDGTDKQDSFANRLSDIRWREFSKAFGYGNLAGSRVLLSDFRSEVAQQYLERAFEARVGDVDADMRLAMNFRREAARIAALPQADRNGWFQIMGQRPLRTVMETALGLPSSIGTIDIDQQRDLFESKFEKAFGEKSVAVLQDPEMIDRVLKRFFLQTEFQNGPSASTPGIAALNVLSTSTQSSTQSINLLVSNLR